MTPRVHRRKRKTPHRIRSPLMRAPLLRTIGPTGQRMQFGDWVAVFGLISSLGALTIGVLTFFQDQGAIQRETSSSLQVVKASVKTVEDIKGQIIDTSYPESQSDTQLTSSVIDLLLENTGGKTAIITSATATIRQVQKFEACRGGPIYVSGFYQIKVPDTQDLPVDLRVDLPFSVDGNSEDRLVISIGPERSSSSDWGSIYQTEVTLQLGDGTSLNVGKFILWAPVFNKK